MAELRGGDLGGYNDFAEIPLADEGVDMEWETLDDDLKECEAFALSMRDILKLP